MRREKSAGQMNNMVAEKKLKFFINKNKKLNQQTNGFEFVRIKGYLFPRK